MKERYIRIANIPLKVSAERYFPNINSFLRRLEIESASQPLGEIKILRADKRAVGLSEDTNTLFITGRDIDDLANPFNLIGILQALFRFAGTKSPSRDIYLMHGSCSIINGKAVLFSDDGTSTAKTLCSIECSLESNKFLGDEFCFLNARNGKIFSYGFIPIHFRHCVKDHLYDNHGFSLPKSIYKETAAGFFNEPEKLFTVIDTAQLHSICYVHFGDKSSCIKLPILRARKALKTCLISHIVKLYDPSKDRMSFSDKSDSLSKKISYGESENKLAKIFLSDTVLKDLSKKIPSYRIELISPCHIKGILAREVFV
jgi:hypothetical protein